MLTADISISGGAWDESIFPLVHRVLGVSFDTAALDTWRRAESCEVSVLLCDDERMRAINRDWRGKDKSTNVLSFPQEDGIVLADKPLCLGDIILSYGVVYSESIDKGIDFALHFKHLLIHGFLHLANFEHESDSGAEVMESMESKILTSLVD